jgi:hypothetical protein
MIYVGNWGFGASLWLIRSTSLRTCVLLIFVVGLVFREAWFAEILFEMASNRDILDLLFGRIK